MESLKENLKQKFSKYMCAIDSLHYSKKTANERECELIKEHGKDKTIKPPPEPIIKEVRPSSQKCRLAAMKTWAKRKN
jgi:hypothetical protein